MADSDEELEDEGSEGESSVIKSLRKQVKDLKAGRTERESQLERENALLKAGLGGLSDKQVKALAATHEGEITPEALAATAKELGFVVAKPEPKTDQRQDAARGTDVQSILEQLNAQTDDEESTYDAELAAIGRTNSASVGSTPANADPMQTLLKQMNEAGSMEELLPILAQNGLLSEQ